MRNLKKFTEYVEEGVVKKQFPDKSRAENLAEESKRKFNSLNRIKSKVGIDDENANDIIENCYDIIIGLIRAKMLLRGFSSLGAGAHEAEVAFLKELKMNEKDVQFINQLRYFRNGILYYGKRFDKDYAEKVFNFLRRIFILLTNN